MISFNTPSAPVYDEVEFNFTGFGEFGGIKDNPTTHLVNHIKDNLDKYREEFLIGEACVLKVAAEDCINYIAEIMTILEKKQALNPKCKQILIHAGVHGGSDQISLESFGYNLANFTIPDVRNYKPIGQPINLMVPVDHAFNTMIPTQILLPELSKDHKVGLSTNPGRYICNYIYYLSLMEGHARNIHSIFVHVPQFKEINKEKQIKFFEDFMRSIKKYYTTRKEIVQAQSRCIYKYMEHLINFLHDDDYYQKLLQNLIFYS